jgi:electron transfer flavoprotein alpha subunit
MSALCLLEFDGTAIADASLRALTLARGLADGDGALAAVAFASPQDVPVEMLAAYGVSEVHVVEPGRLPGYAPAAWARVLADMAGSTEADLVAAAATDHGSEVMAHLAAMTGQPLAANCVSVRPGSGEPGSYLITRQRWAGLLLEDAEITGSPALVTVPPDGVAAVPADAPAELTVHPCEPALDEADLRVRARESAGRVDGVSLATARVVVGGGRGVGGPDGFAPLEELSKLLGGVLGVSRVVTSEGWRPHQQQVGQTGTRIAPELYLACGISGAIQHMAGCQGAKHIVAINTDPGAPIMARADYAVIGDLHEVIPELVTAIRARGGSS